MGFHQLNMKLARLTPDCFICRRLFLFSFGSVELDDKSYYVDKAERVAMQQQYEEG